MLMVWLLTGGGAMFAAFPIWYGKLFSGYYIAFVLMLVALIMQGVSFEFRGKLGDNKLWIKVCICLCLLVVLYHQFFGG